MCVCFITKRTLFPWDGKRASNDGQSRVDGPTTSEPVWSDSQVIDGIAIHSSASSPEVRAPTELHSGFDPESDKARIKEVLKSWMASGALVKAEFEDQHRKKRPVIEVGEWAFE